MSMTNTHIVFLTADHDCDGTSYAAHRVSVPMHRAQDLLSVPALAEFLRGTEVRYGQYVSDAYEVRTEQAFLASDEFRDLSAWDKEYWAEEGYARLWTDWAPWAGPNGDDSIGIPALDHTYDVEVF
jgi:hypothetical protein